MTEAASVFLVLTMSGLLFVLEWLCSSSIVSGHALDGIWIQSLIIGDKTSRNTPDIYNYYTSVSNYHIYPAQTQSMKFSVKTCHHANLLLSAAVDLQSSDLYEISIGDLANNRTKLHRKDKSGSMFTIHTPRIVSCTAQITFVISWKSNGNILLIKETQNGTEIIFDWTDPSPLVIKGVGIATAWGSEGLWIIQHTAVFTGHYCFVSGTYGFMSLLSTSIERSEIGCLSQCSPNDTCLGVNFNSDTNECQLISAAQPIIKDILEDWVLYTKCLQGDMMCLACLE